MNAIFILLILPLRPHTFETNIPFLKPTCVLSPGERTAKTAVWEHWVGAHLLDMQTFQDLCPVPTCGFPSFKTTTKWNFTCSSFLHAEGEVTTTGRPEPASPLSPVYLWTWTWNGGTHQHSKYEHLSCCEPHLSCTPGRPKPFSRHEKHTWSEYLTLAHMLTSELTHHSDVVLTSVLDQHLRDWI